jgi:hypothetical protein
MSYNKNIAIAAIATFMVASVSPVCAQEDVRQVLTDKTSQEVMEYRKQLNDHDLLHEMEVKGQYKDHITGYDGNVTDPVRFMSKYQASQGFSIGIFGGCSHFAGNFLPRIGVEATYGYRWLYGTLWASLGRGVYDEDASKSEDFLEENFGLEVGAEFAHWKDHHHQVYFLIGGELKLRKDFKDMSFGEDSPVDFQYTFNGRTFGAYAGLKYQYSPRFSSWSMYVKATGGFNQNYKGNILSSVDTENYREYSIGGTKIYPEVTLTIGVNVNIFNKKVYNYNAMNKAGLTKAQVKAMKVLKNY